jgi:hypothetical protein
MPQFLVGLPAIIRATIGSSGEGGEVALQTDPAEYVVSKAMDLQGSGACRLIGDFDSMCLQVLVAGLQLVWAFQLPIPLQVCEARDPISFDLKMPCFLAAGAVQAAVFIVDHADPSIVELSVGFSMSGLREIRFGDAVFEAGQTVTVDQVPHRMVFLLVFRLTGPGDDSVSVTISMVKSGGQQSQLTDVFEAPPKVKMPVRLQRQSERCQQFMICNPFPVGFSFSSNGRPNRVRPNASYSFLRPASPAPLRLTLAEDGWEDFPVEVVATDFLTGGVVVALTVEPGEWTAGSPQLVRVNPPSFTVPNKDWVVIPQDMRGETHLFIPRRPGVLEMPDFQIGQQTCTTEPRTALVNVCDCPPFVLL